MRAYPDDLFDRWDQTDPEMQKGIVLSLLNRQLAFDDLLAALEELMALHDCGPGAITDDEWDARYTAALQTARAALARAKGP